MQTEEGMSFEDAVAQIQANRASKAEVEAVAPEAEAAVTESAPSTAGGGEQANQAGHVPDASQAQVAPAPGAEGQPPAQGGGVDPAVKRLLDREAALLEREKALAAFEAAKRKFKYDPVSAVKAIAPEVSLSEIAKALWVEELGDLAPPEAKQAKEVRGVRSEVEDLRAQVEEERRRLAEEYARQQQEQVYYQYTGAIGSAIKAVDAKANPLVAKFVAKHSDSAVDELLSIARSHAQAAGEVLTPADLIARFEAQLGRYQVVDPSPAPVVTQEVTPPAATTTSLRNSHQQVQPNLKPADELDDEFLFAKAMKAIAENRKRSG